MQAFPTLHAGIVMSSAKMGYISLHAGRDVQNCIFLHAGSNAHPDYAQSNASREYVILLNIPACMQGVISNFCRGHENACRMQDARSDHKSSNFFPCHNIGAFSLMGHVILWGISSYGACHLMGHIVLWGMTSYGACHLMGMLSYGAYHLLSYVVL